MVFKMDTAVSVVVPCSVSRTPQIRHGERKTKFTVQTASEPLSASDLFGSVTITQKTMIDQHEREVTGIDWSKPSSEPHKLSHRIPGWDEIPEEFKEWGNPIAADWRAREGINEAEAKWHLEYISNSWEYAVEHKRAALRWLHSLWFTDGVEPNKQALPQGGAKKGNDEH